MYASYFGLSENPFTITPDPRYLYLGARHSEALAHLLYGVTESGGFIQLTGEVGTGKTMLVRSLLEQLPDTVDVALVFNPGMHLHEFLRAICRELGVSGAANQSAAEMTDTLNRYLLDAHARGRRVVLIIDEAQGLPGELLEQVRLLTNLETGRHKLMQIILVGQPELREVLARRSLRQLAQRVTGRYHLMPLDLAETRAYIDHRLEVAGAGGPIFNPAATRKIHKLAGGIPRLINILADRALTGAYARQRRQCGSRLVARAAAEALVPVRRARLWPRALVAVLAAVAVGFAVVVGQAWWMGGKRAGGQTAVAVQTAGSPQDALAGWLRAAGRDAGTDGAFSALFGLWNAHYTARGTPACRQARAAGLRCLFRTGTWQDLMAYDRPAILNLTLADGSRYQVVVSGVAGSRVMLRAGGATRTFSRAALRRDWNGTFLILWQPPPKSDGLLKRGMSGSAVAWLEGRLERLDQALATSSAPERDYDAALAGAVRRFQRTHGLHVDGIAGERTLIELNSALAGSGVPRLTATGTS
jgi:general secretion pathway protein A